MSHDQLLNIGTLTTKIDNKEDLISNNLMSSGKEEKKN